MMYNAFDVTAFNGVTDGGITCVHKLAVLNGRGGGGRSSWIRHWCVSRLPVINITTSIMSHGVIA